MKVVVNRRYGGFSVSKAVYDELGLEWDGYGYLIGWRREEDTDQWMETEELRSHPLLIAAIEKVGVEAASGGLASLEVVEIPDDVDWYISEYDGWEHIAERHRTW